MPLERSRRSSARRLVASVIAVLTLLVASGLAACSGSSSTALPPTTGILIRAETLTAGHGCGRDPTQLFKYAVVVFGYGGTGDPAARSSYTEAVTSNVFDCFSDGAFISLDPKNGSFTFRLEVYAFNEPAYAAARTTIDTAGTDTTGLRGTSPTWTTECSATQQADVQALASCLPLAPGLSGLGGTAGATRITLATARFNLPNGAVASCGPDPASPDGGDGLDGGDGGNGSGPDASDGDASSDASAPEAGAPVHFTTVRVRPRVNATVAGPSVDLACPAAYLADVAPEPVRYELDVALLDGKGNLVTNGQTVCTVTSVPGATSSAVCP